MEASIIDGNKNIFIQHNEISNVLSTFMSIDPKHCEIFKTQELSLKEKFFFNQLLSNCSICLNNIKYPCQISICSHIFCYKCICRWKKLNKICPICRVKFKKLIKLKFK